VYVPQVAETLDAYRLSLVAVTKVPDPRGKVRHLLSRMQDQVSVGITVEGSLLKITGPEGSIEVTPGEPIDVPLAIASSPKLTAPVRLELDGVPAPLKGKVSAEAVEVPRGADRATFRIGTTNDAVVRGTQTFVLRAVVLEPGEVPPVDDTVGATPLDVDMLGLLKAGSLPVIAEAPIVVVFR
jgi:hypothetical protein